MDRDLQRLAFVGGSPFSGSAEACSGCERLLSAEEQAMQAIANGSAEHRKIEAEIVNGVKRLWEKRDTAALILDIVTIACIMWLLLR